LIIMHDCQRLLVLKIVLFLFKLIVIVVI
jgi:hypothetical protein